MNPRKRIALVAHDNKKPGRVQSFVADFMISSPLMSSSYERSLPDYDAYNDRLEALAV